MEPLSFNVDGDNYGIFISNVRKMVEESCTPGTVDVPPMLPEEKKVPEKWFYIDLFTSNTSLRLFIRMDNLYLVGFRTASGEWWEFNNGKEPHLIPDANWLGFGCSYLELIGGKLKEVPLGRTEMSFAVIELGKHTGEEIVEEQLQGGEDDPYAKPKKMLARLVIMLCEGLRFCNVSGTVNKAFIERSSTMISDKEAIHVNCWLNISKAVLTNDFSQLKKETEIKNRSDAKEVVALLKNPKKTTDENEDNDLYSLSTSGVTTVLA